METEERKIIGVEAACFKCGEVWNVSLLRPTDYGTCCETCGGYVVAPDGKIQKRNIYEGDEIKSPLLDPRRKQLKAKKTVHNESEIPIVTDFTAINKLRTQGGN